MALLLDSLIIENFRGFRSLKIEKLGRVNLIVGKNGSGKSALLEAIRIYASRANHELLIRILNSRDELVSSTQGTPLERTLSAFQQLFNGRPRQWGGAPGIFIGPSIENALTMEMSKTERGEPLFVVAFEGDREARLIGDFGSFTYLQKEPIAPHVFVPPNGYTNSEAATLFDRLALTDLENIVIEALQVVEPNIERMLFIGDTTGPRIPMVKLRTGSHPVPLRSLGDGMNRFLGIAISMASAHNGFLLIDETENGLHFGVQRDLWRMIFKTAHRLNVQIFATTHSADCVEAFQKSSIEDTHEEAILIRLDTRRDDVRSFVLSERELSIATRDALEVR